MVMVKSDKHNAIVDALKNLVQSIKDMKPRSTDSLLVWLEREADSWLDFAASHQDSEELRSLKGEIVARFYGKYNVRIEPKNLDEKRLTAFENVISALEAGEQ